MSQNEKITFLVETVSSGAKEILSTTTATERLTKAIEEQGDQVQSLQQKMDKMEGFEKSTKRAKDLATQLDKATGKFDQLSAELEQQKKTSRDLRSESRKTEKEIKALNAALVNASGEGVNEIKEKMAQAEQKAESLNAELFKSTNRTRDLGTEKQKATKKVKELTEAQIKHRRRTANLSSELRKAGVSTRDLAGEQKRLKVQADQSSAALAKQNARLREMQNIQSRIDGRNAKLGEIRGQATSLAVAAAPLAGSMYMAMKNESSFADVEKVLPNNIQGKDVEGLRSWALKYSASSTMNAEQINALLAAGAQSGIKDIDELKKFTINSSKMGTAFDMDAAEAGDTMSTFRASLGLNQDDAFALAGVINQLSNNSDGKVTAKDISEVMAREGATAKIAGLSNNESAALASSFLQAGMQPEVAATAMKRSVGALTKGYAATGSQRKALNRIGFTPEQLATNMQKDATGTIQSVLKAINNTKPEERSALISQIFGEEAVKGISILSGNMKLFENALKESSITSKEATESIEDEYKKKLETSMAGTTKFMNKLSRLAIVFGVSLLPALDAVLKPLGWVVDQVADFAEANETLTAAVGLGISAFIGIKGAILAGKAASLIFGNTMDRTRLFRRGLNRETERGGRAAQLAATRFNRLNAAISRSGYGGRGRGGYGYGGGGYYGDYYGGEGSRRSRGRRPQPRTRPGPRARGFRGRLGAALNFINPMSLFGRGRSVNQAARPGIFRRGLNAVGRGGASLANLAGRGLGAVGRGGANLLGLAGRSLGAVGRGGANLLGTAGRGIGSVARGGANLVGMAGRGLGHVARGGANVLGVASRGIGTVARGATNVVGKAFRPLGMIMAGADLYSAVAHGGSNEEIGESVGNIGGGLAGAAAGAAIGSVVPVVGTAIGGLVGGLIGAFGGEAIGGWFGKKLDTPDETAQKIAEANAKAIESRERPNVAMENQFVIHASPGMSEEEVARLVSNQMKQQTYAALSENNITTQLAISGMDYQ